MELVTIELHESYTHVSLIGRLDIAGVERLEPRFTACIVPRRVHAFVDISGVVFISSLGIGTLVRVARTLGVHKATLVLVSPTALVRGALEHARVTSLLPIADSLEHAHRIARATSFATETPPPARPPQE
jgi:anti-anti-sigma factor